MKDQYLALKDLERHTGYTILLELWMIQLAKIEEGRSRAAKRSQESAWRFWAGQEEGFKLATTALQRALKDIEKEDESMSTEEKVTQMMEKLKIKTTGDSQ